MMLSVMLSITLSSCAMLEETMAPPSSSEAEAPVSSEASSSEASSASNQLARRKTPNTAADVFKAIAYEQEKNPDALGWLMIPGMSIDDPVVQSHDNLYYLRRTDRGAEDIYGCYFADAECSLSPNGELSRNTVIYGHSDLQDNPDGPKFSQLFRLTEKTFAEETPCIYFSTAGRYMVWEIFAVFYTDLDDVNYIAVSGLDDAGLSQLIAQARERSIYHYDIPFEESGEHILTLSTCTVKYGSRSDQRFVVMARLLPDGEEPQRAKLEVNPNPVQPEF